MPIFDVEPFPAFSGSSGDHVMSGALLQSVTVVGGISTIVIGNRFEVGSNVSGAILGYVSGTTEYGAYVNAVTGGFRLEQHNIRNVSLFQTSEMFFDTMMPSIDDIMNVDCKGALLSISQNPNPTGNYPLAFIYLIGVSSSGILCEITESVSVPQGTGERLSNNTWASSFPFQYRYKNARRTIDPLSSLNQIKYAASAAFRQSSPWYVAGYSDVSQSAAEPTVPTDNPFLGGGSAINARLISTAKFSVAYVVPKNDAAISTTDKKVIVLFTTGGFVDNSRNFSPSILTTYAQPNPANINLQPLQPQTSDVVKHFYGFGDGPNNTVEFGSTNSSSWVSTAIPYKVGYGSKIRGWKYGITSGFEVNPKCVFRRDRFGHFRDMLEQRPLSKLLNKVTNTISTVIEVNFISGSDLPPGVDAYATASFKPQENVGDSGIYSREYACGQPWGER